MDTTEGQRRLVQDHLGLVRAQAAAVMRRLPAVIEFDDLVGYGTTGLCEAAARFEPERGLSFSTFAYYRIRGAIYDGLRTSGWLSRREWARVRERERVDAYLQSRAERSPAPTTSLGDDVASLSDALAGATTIIVTSLEGERTPEAIADGPAPGEALELGELGAEVRRAVSGLPEQERQIVEGAYFGGQSLLEAGAAIGISKSWASRLHASAIDHLRRALEPTLGGEPRAAGRRAAPSGRGGTPAPGAGPARGGRGSTPPATARPPRR